MTGREWDRFFMAIFRPDLLPWFDSLPLPKPSGWDPFEPDDEDPPAVLAPLPVKTTKRGVPVNRHRDPTRYRFMSPEGQEFIGTRCEFEAAFPKIINPGALHDLVKGKCHTAKGWTCSGAVR